MDSDYDVKTRVTGLEQLKIGQSGQGCLVVIHAPTQTDLGRLHTLAKEITTIGRGRDNDIVLPSDCVSRRHSRLERRDQRLYVVDLASTTTRGWAPFAEQAFANETTAILRLARP